MDDFVSSFASVANYGVGLADTALSMHFPPRHCPVEQRTGYEEVCVILIQVGKGLAHAIA